MFPGTFNMALGVGGVSGPSGPTYWLATAYEGGATTDGVLVAEVEVDSTGNMYVLGSMNSTTYGTDGNDFVITNL